jgi:hypothetical protein
MDLKIGGNSVGKIMYNGQEFSGTTKLEPGTILYIATVNAKPGLENVHLLSTTKNWSNINGINVKMYNKYFSELYVDINITGDDFKNLDTEKEYSQTDNNKVTVSRSIVDGEYRLNISSDNYVYVFEIIAL